MQRRLGSADNLVGLEDEPWRNGEAQGLSGLHIDDQLERGGLLHGEVRRLRPVQELIDVADDARIRSPKRGP